MKNTIAFLLFISISFQSFAQSADSVSDETMSRLAAFAKKATLFGYNYAQEKAYLHFDNTGYFLGENIWFMAYVVNAMNNTPTDMSKTLYVELLTSEGEVLQNKKIRVKNGVGSGSFYLADSLPGGYYEVRAYTRSMLNFGNEVIFSRVFPVFSAVSTEGDYTVHIMKDRKYKVPKYRPDREDGKTVDMTFYPEGGSLVLGLTSNVAFKVTDKHGRNLEVTGALFDEKENKVAVLRTRHDGMGVFSFTPEAGKYQAEIYYGSEKFRFTLPSAETSGFVMTVLSRETSTSNLFGIELSEDSVYVFVRKSYDIQPNTNLALAVGCRGKLLDVRLVSASVRRVLLTFAKKRLPAGVNQFTLYDSDGKIRSERLYFNVPTADQYQTGCVSVPGVSILSYDMDKTVYKSCEQVKMQLYLSDTTNVNMGSSISLAVRDASTSNFGTPDNTNIVTNLLLSSDLKGFINNPAWYFQNNDLERQAGLDLLTLTQGWRRYKWERMAGLELFNAKYPIEDGIIIDGEVRSLLLKRPMPDLSLNLWLNRGTSLFESKATTDSLGVFKFKIDELYDQWNLILKTSKKEKAKETRILLNRQFTPEPRSYEPYEQDVIAYSDQIHPDKPGNSLKAQDRDGVYTEDAAYKGDIKLKEVVSTAKYTVPFRQEIDRLATVRIDYQKAFDAIRDKGEAEPSNIFDFLYAQNSYFKLVFDAKTERTSVYYKSKPIIMKYIPKEGNILQAWTQMYSTNYSEDGSGIFPKPSEIDKIIIVEDYAALNRADFEDRMGDMLGNEDVVYVFVVLNDVDTKIPQGYRTTKFEGYALSKEFYSPMYPSDEPQNGFDYRRTLYWNPDLTLGKDGKVEVSFYNNSTCKSMSVSAEGITSNGILLINR
jgi:hypothetical protein